jgi:hypothetical protein
MRANLAARRTFRIIGVTACALGVTLAVAPAVSANEGDLPIMNTTFGEVDALTDTTTDVVVPVTVQTTDGSAEGVAGELVFAAYKFAGGTYSSTATVTEARGLTADNDGEIEEFNFDTAGRGNATYKFVATFTPDEADEPDEVSDTSASPAYTTVYKLESKVSYTRVGTTGNNYTFEIGAATADSTHSPKPVGELSIDGKKPIAVNGSGNGTVVITNQNGNWTTAQFTPTGTGALYYTGSSITKAP